MEELYKRAPTFKAASIVTADSTLGPKWDTA